MLQDMGIPVEGERGPDGAYQLRRGHKLPPLMFTNAEAVSLTLGLLAIREYQFPVDIASVEGALAKTERVLPEQLLQQVRGLQDSIAFNVDPPTVLSQPDLLTNLSLAVQERKQVLMRYQSWQGKSTERTFDPYGIVFNEGYWYTAGYCHLRQDLRTFRLDRIVALEPGKRSFERPATFDVLAFVLNSVALLPGTTQIEVLMDTSIDHARQVVKPTMGSLEESKQGVVFRRAATQLKGIALFLLSLDFPLTIIQTPELRERIRQIGACAREITEENEDRIPP